MEITDLSEGNATRAGMLRRCVLNLQRSLASHPRFWRLSSVGILALLGLLVLGWIIGGIVLLPGGHALPGSATPFTFATRPSFNPYAYPTDEQPAAIYGGHDGEVLTVAWSPDGTRFASGGLDNTVQVWNTVTHTKLVYSGHTNEVLGVAWSPDGHYIASVSRDGTVQVWNADTGQRVWMYQNGVAVYSVAWSRTNLLAFGDDTGVVQIWNMQTHQYVRHLVGHQAPVVTMSWSPDDRFLATGSMDFTVRVWLVSTGRTLLVYTHGDVVSTLAWSPNGQYIASGSYDTTVQVWNAQTGQRLLNYQDHTNAVYGLAWSPAGTEIASAGDDGTIQVWKLNGQHVITYLTNATCLAWSPDGQWLVSGSPTGQMMVWRVHGFYG